MNLGETLKKLRLSHGFTQQNIADMLCINRSTYTYYETGKTQPDILTIKQLALLYDVDIDSLLGGQQEIKAQRKRPKKLKRANPQRIGELSSQEKSVIAQLRVLTTEDISLLINELQHKLVGSR